MSFIIEAIKDGISAFISGHVLRGMGIIAGFLMLSLSPKIKRLRSYFSSKKNKPPIIDEITSEDSSNEGEKNISDAESLFILAAKYEHGKGVPQDLMKAAELYRKASDLGHAKAKFSLANMYRDGRGVNRSYQTAANLYYESAEKGNTKAMCALARMYIDGRGVERNYSLAVKWYQKAVDGGDMKAMYTLAKMYRDGTAAEKNNQAAYMLFFLLKLMGDKRNEIARSLNELTVVLSIEQIKIAEETARKVAEEIRSGSAQGIGTNVSG